MAWSTISKDLGVTKKVAHTAKTSGLTGRAPGISTITFSPLTLFGATARCSHLHVINPHVLSQEAVIVKSLVENYVDDVSTDFAILSGIDDCKDFMRSYFAGTVASGLSYLAMINDGYTWTDHFENLTGGATGVRTSPDFVFAGYGTGAALVESKGSRGNSTNFDKTVSDGYTRQVEPHLGSTIGGVNATHGYCVGSYMKSTTKAELRIHHTAVPVASGGGGGGGGGAAAVQSVATVQRGNYANALIDAHSVGVGQSVRRGSDIKEIDFFEFRWLGEDWITGHLGLFNREIHTWSSAPDARGFFALRKSVAIAVFDAYIGAEKSPALWFDQPEEKDKDFRLAEDDEGTVFPDGLAFISEQAELADPRPGRWERRDRRPPPRNYDFG